MFLISSNFVYILQAEINKNNVSTGLHTFSKLIEYHCDFFTMLLCQYVI